MANPNYVLLREITLNATAASVTLDNIPQTGYTDLKLVYSGRNSVGGVGIDLYISFNGSTSNLTVRRLHGTGSSVASYSGTTGDIGVDNTSATTTSTFSNMEVYIPNYAGSAYKSYSADAVEENNGTTAYAQITAGLWSNTAAITSMTFTPYSGNFVANSSFSLYGIAAVGTTPTVVPKASGGDIVVNDGTYWYHAFLASGTFIPNTTISADLLVVGGGGSAGASNVGSSAGQGGGGAGGVTLYSSQSLNSSCSVTVGAGGSASNSVSVGSQAGSPTTFSGLTAVAGGGQGGSWEGTGTYSDGSSGASGGGASGATSVKSGGSATNGNAGGNGLGGAPYAGGGGGGKGTAGGNASGAGGNGGNGTSTYSSWASATGTGSGGYYAAGGGGGSSAGGGSGGTGGGGGGGSGTVAATAGAANTGSGGGGALSSLASGNGGSGIVIIRYSMS